MYLWNLLNLLLKAEIFSRLDQVESLKYPENNFHILSGQLIPVITHFHSEVLNVCIHIIRTFLVAICDAPLLPFHVHPPST